MKKAKLLKSVKTSWAKLFLSLSAAVFCLGESDNPLPNFNKNKLVSQFNEMDLSINAGEGYSRSTNENGVLAWAQSYLLEAYLDMYEATGDIQYLEKFVFQADNVIALTDKARNLKDYRGRLVVGWAATKYNSNKLRVVYLVHTGMLTYPLAKFTPLVNKNEQLKEKFSSKANTYKTLAVEALSVFEPEWNFDEETKTGFYLVKLIEINSSSNRQPKDIPDISIPVPLNQQLAAGRTFVILCEKESNPFFCEKARALAKHFQNRLIKDKDGAYIWHYWFNEGLDISNTIEDISHGAIDLDFALLAHRDGRLFDRQDIKAFLKTYSQNVYHTKIAKTVDGRGSDESKDALGGWMELAEYDCKVWHDFKSLLESNQLSKHPQVMLGIAKLIKYYDRCVAR